MCDMTDVKVAGEKYIGPAFDQSRHHRFRPTDNIVLVEALGQIEWMMRDDDLNLVFVQGGKFSLELSDLLLTYASALDRKRTRCVDAEHGDLVVDA